MPVPLVFVVPEYCFPHRNLRAHWVEVWLDKEFLKVSELNLINIKCKTNHHTEAHTSIVWLSKGITLEHVVFSLQLRDLELQL